MASNAAANPPKPLKAPTNCGSDVISTEIALAMPITTPGAIETAMSHKPRCTRTSTNKGTENMWCQSQ